jgi:hypothetical protein
MFILIIIKAGMIRRKGTLWAHQIQLANFK